jgi:hypothetical protein
MKDKSSGNDHPNGNDPTPQPFTRKAIKGGQDDQASYRESALEDRSYRHLHHLAKHTAQHYGPICHEDPKARSAPPT